METYALKVYQVLPTIRYILYLVLIATVPVCTGTLDYLVHTRLRAIVALLVLVDSLRVAFQVSVCHIKASFPFFLSFLFVRSRYSTAPDLVQGTLRYIVSNTKLTGPDSKVPFI